MAHNETVFTPEYIVKLILDEIGYVPMEYTAQEENKIRRRHIVDNSCGDGAFLCEVVRRYFRQSICDGYDKDKTIEENNKLIKEELETYIHGIELKSNLVELTKDALDNVVGEFIDLNVLGKINWDIRCADALDISDFDGKMDYVVGNPPYCNVHHFGEKYEKYKTYSFMKDGMSDLYLLFFELGFKMLNPNGSLAYITPNSWFTSIAGKSLRKYIRDGNINIDKIIQCGHEQVFSSVTTFSAITVFSKNHINHSKTFVWKTLNQCLEDYDNDTERWWKVNVDDAFINNKIYLGQADQLQFIRNILNNNKPKRVLVKNGFATLKDKLFTNVMWLLGWLPPEMIYAIKSSTCEIKMLFYPYDRNGKPKKWEEFHPKLQSHLLDRAKALNINTTKDGWYLYGRTQGINDFMRYKIAVNNLINDSNDGKCGIKMAAAPAGVGVYGGLYMTPSESYANNEDFDELDFNTKIFALLHSEMFMDYVKMLGHYKNGGYYTFTSKELESFLNYGWDILL